MIQVAPNELVFTYAPFEPIKSFLSLKNRGNSLLSFKIKCTVTEHFEVIPNRGDLRVGEHKTVQFRTTSILNRQTAKNLLSQAKFMLQCVPISREGQGDDEEIWKVKSMVENHRINIRVEGFDESFKPVTPQNGGYASMKREVTYVKPLPPATSYAKPIKHRTLNRWMAILLLFMMGIILGYGLRWYHNFRATRVQIVPLTHPISSQHPHNIVLPHEVQQAKVVYVPQSHEYNIKFKAEDIPSKEKEYRLHIDQNGQSTIIQLT